MKTRFLVILSVTLVITMMMLFSTRARSSSELPKLQTGDLIFRTSKNRQSSAIVLATRSPYSHVGLVVEKKKGEYIVLEAVSHVGETPLKRWIEHGYQGWVTIKRCKELTQAQRKEILAEAQKYIGRPYDLFFMFGNKEIYCSELIYLAYKHAGIELGKIEKVQQLYVHNAVVEKLIQQRLDRHPLYKTQGKEAAWEALMEQELITPASVAGDKKLTTIYTNYPLSVF